MDWGGEQVKTLNAYHNGTLIEMLTFIFSFLNNLYINVYMIICIFMVLKQLNVNTYIMNGWGHMPVCKCASKNL